MYLSRTTILNLSLEIERRGIEFYTAMKGRIDADFIDYLIEQEREHIRTFNELFSEGGGPDRFENLDMDDDYVIAAYAGTEIFARIDPAAVSRSELFEVAIDMEKNSILFYGDLADSMGDRFEKEAAALRRLREEERTHLKTLVRKKRELAV